MPGATYLSLASPPCEGQGSRYDSVQLFLVVFLMEDALTKTRRRHTLGIIPWPSSSDGLSQDSLTQISLAFRQNSKKAVRRIVVAR